MAEQRDRARAASQFEAEGTIAVDVDESTVFTGYGELAGQSAVLALAREGEAVETLAAGAEGVVVLEATPFYAESGGQVGDQGYLYWDNGKFEVAEVHYLAHKVIAHRGRMIEGELVPGTAVTAEVNVDGRAATAANHSATHLLHAALRQMLGEHVQQKGSLVAPDRLRFDFSHGEAMAAEQVDAVESIVNRQIRANLEVRTRLMGIEEAQAQGAMALFGERYDDEVRVVSMGDVSLELCGGTHVGHSGDIGTFRILSESGIAAGVRRLEAVTGEVAGQQAVVDGRSLDRLAAMFKTGRTDLEERAQALVGRVRELERKVEQLQGSIAAGGSGDDPLDDVRKINDTPVLVKRYDNVDIKSLRAMMDRLRDRLGSAVVVIGGAHEGKATLLVGVTRDLADRFHAGQLVSELAGRVGGKGGGRADMAQGGGADIAALDAALATVDDWISAR